MGLILPPVQYLLDFLELRKVLSTCDGDLRDPLWWPQDWPVHIRVARGPLGILLLSNQGLSPCVESGPETEVSSPVLSWILGYYWSLPRGVSLLLERGHARALSSRAVVAVSPIPPRGSKDLWFSLESFPLGLPKGLSHMAVPRAHVVGVDPRLEREGSAGKTGSSGMD